MEYRQPINIYEISIFGYRLKECFKQVIRRYHGGVSECLFLLPVTSNKFLVSTNTREDLFVSVSGRILRI